MTSHPAQQDSSVESSTVHDLGGASGFGPVPVDDDVIFHADWERRAFSVTQLSQVVARFNTDAFRHGIEREDPDLYVGLNYFDKWIRNAERMLVEGGVVAPDAISARLSGGVSTQAAVRTTDATPPEAKGCIRQPEQAPKFDTGQTVVAETGSLGHTRLPGYAAGKPGTIVAINGGWIYPDSHAHGQGEQPTWVYSVAYRAQDLWPEDGQDHLVYIDVFEPYLQVGEARD